LSPLLRRSGVNRLEGIFLTDFSSRHAGGLPTLMSNFSVRSLLFPGASKATHGLDASVNPRGRKRTTRLAVYPGDEVALEGRAAFQVLDVVDGRVFLLIHYEGLKFLLLPTWKPDALKRMLGRPGLGEVDVLILPAYGEPPDWLWREVVSRLFPAHVVFPRRNAGFGTLAKLLEQEEIPFFFLSETGALRFEVQDQRLLISAFLRAP